ncbi:hypothetical protein SSP24_74280 [Streptomyces spinoverrucosus]|uniref:Uncharacterized protein n=1 Tax=Streptomyces spinoverrucosus TaxID=284043 RepID=A0A4Y3VT14_9ACTN|nr:hypothetical protein SSP24_74280 [Streptomyces spinoverrucosus]GHB52260.1 hypothetical protein GCM10010397_22670 [Streptomyces spinoverrucosus]
MRPRTRQRVRGGEADTAVGAGDDRRPTGEVGKTAHVPLARVPLGSHEPNVGSDNNAVNDNKDGNANKADAVNIAIR